MTSLFGWISGFCIWNLGYGEFLVCALRINDDLPNLEPRETIECSLLESWIE